MKQSDENIKAEAALASQVDFSIDCLTEIQFTIDYSTAPFSKELEELYLLLTQLMPALKKLNECRIEQLATTSTKGGSNER